MISDWISLVAISSNWNWSIRETPHPTAKFLYIMTQSFLDFVVEKYIKRLEELFWGLQWVNLLPGNNNDSSFIFNSARNYRMTWPMKRSSGFCPGLRSDAGHTGGEAAMPYPHPSGLSPGQPEGEDWGAPLCTNLHEIGGRNHLFSASAGLSALCPATRLEAAQWFVWHLIRLYRKRAGKGLVKAGDLKGRK